MLVLLVHSMTYSDLLKSFDELKNNSFITEIWTDKKSKVEITSSELFGIRVEETDSIPDDCIVMKDCRGNLEVLRLDKDMNVVAMFSIRAQEWIDKMNKDKPTRELWGLTPGERFMLNH